ncbi:DeoR family transcriptional regulator [Agriterribacter sp.]|uniref:DeoR family transcriptional regulator n=1 Tax=Agriterribacter sp. TaxID=2821509 RepID=UPI0039C8A504
MLNLLAQNGEVFVEALSKRFKVSEVTIHNNLDQLERMHPKLSHCFASCGR